MLRKLSTAEEGGRVAKMQLCWVSQFLSGDSVKQLTTLTAEPTTLLFSFLFFSSLLLFFFLFNFFFVSSIKDFG